MKHSPQCLPCFLRRVLSTANVVMGDEWLHRKLLGETMVDLSHVDDKSTPPEVIHDVLRKTAKTLGNPDPFAEAKARWREEVLGNEDAIRELIAGANDRFTRALTAAVVANLVDDELREDVTLRQILVSVADQHLDPDTVDELRASIQKAKSLLFVHDSVGELFFDRLLIEEITTLAPGIQVTSVVRAAPALADATLEDAEALGIPEVTAAVVDPGLDCLGLPLPECSAEFRDTFAAADLVLAKGQAAYQSLEADGRAPGGHEKEVWFLFRVKCPVMSQQLALNIGDLFLERN